MCAIGDIVGPPYSLESIVPESGATTGETKATVRLLTKGSIIHGVCKCSCCRYCSCPITYCKITRTSISLAEAAGLRPFHYLTN